MYPTICENKSHKLFIRNESGAGWWMIRHDVFLLVDVRERDTADESTSLEPPNAVHFRIHFTKKKQQPKLGAKPKSRSRWRKSCWQKTNTSSIPSTSTPLSSSLNVLFISPQYARLERSLLLVFFPTHIQPADFLRMIIGIARGRDFWAFFCERLCWWNHGSAQREKQTPLARSQSHKKNHLIFVSTVFSILTLFKL